MSQSLFKKLYSKKNNWINEEEVRQGWIIALSEALQIDFQAERGKRDASYNNVIIEFKGRGYFKGKTSSKDFKNAIDERLLPYIIKTAKKENIDQSDFIGIAIDGDHICFAQVVKDKIEHGPLLELSEASIRMVVTALEDSYRRALTADSLIEDFGHSSISGVKMMQVLANSISICLNDDKNNKTKMLFEEWRTLFGQVADLSTEQIQSINKTLRFSISVSSKLKIPASLFVIHTFNSLLIKLLAAEIISTHKLTSYNNFSQTLSVKSDDEIIQNISTEIEQAQFFSNAGIDGFVEEALFSWYIDICQDESQKIEVANALREILFKLSFYRSDNLTQAKSKDLLKLFYQNLVPETLRKTLGEFYTPDWLVAFTLNKVKVKWLENRSLDPTCGSGSFLLEIIKLKIEAAKKEKWPIERTISHITSSVWGFDLNPLAVQTARVNYLIAIAELLKFIPGYRIEIPVLLADAIYSPAHDPKDEEDIVKYKIGSHIANLEITLPATLAFDRSKLDEVFEIFGSSIEEDKLYNQAEVKLKKSNTLSDNEIIKWRVPLENTYNNVLNLHQKNWNGIWFRIIKNFFWSSIAGKFDLIAGNPPWVRWSKLPELYRERIKPTCMNYNIFSSTPHHGGNELDISGMITYTVGDKWLADNGTMAFIITQTHFQSPSSEGFRDFKINKTYHLNPQSVDDMKDLKPFPDAANKTAVTIFKKQKNKSVSYPVKYINWHANTGYSRTLPIDEPLSEIMKRISPIVQEATPVTKNNSPWAILPIGRFKQLKKLVGKCDWIQGRKGITADLNGIYFVEILATNDNNKLVQIQTRPDAGKTEIGPAKQFWVESDLLFPLIKGASDFSKCYFERHHSLYAFVPNSGIIKKAYEEAEDLMSRLRKTTKYFQSHKSILEDRSTFKGRMKNAPYYAIYNVGDYTFAPWKVIWAEQKEFCAAVISSDTTPFQGKRPFIPDHKIFFADFSKPEPAYFLCGLLNSDSVIEFVKSHNISIQTGDIFKHMNIPKFNPANKEHIRLSTLAKECHAETRVLTRNELLLEISILAESIIGI